MYFPKLLSGYITCVLCGQASTLTQDAYILYILPESISVTPLAGVVCALGGVNSFVLNLLSSKFVSLSVTINSKAGTYNVFYC